MKADRRTVLGGLGGLAAAIGAGIALPRGEAGAVPGSLGGADPERGHRLRTGDFPAPDRTEQVSLLIAGGGVAGLAAGWTLAEAGFRDFRLHELEDQVGGNSRSGRNKVSAFPLGAHYLPVANREAGALRHLLRRLGMIIGEKDGAPVYDPYQICADLQERLLWQGRWQEGLIPRGGLSDQDEADLAAFDREMARLAVLEGGDGKPAFAIPIDYSSRDPAFLALDRISFAAWLDAQGWASPVLRGHVRYCMRDDYGCEPAQVSAWAGIHYFAGRRGWAADGTGDQVLTWPDGNDRLSRGMADAFRDRIQKGRIVYRAERTDHGFSVLSYDPASGRSTRILAEALILALPHFIAARVAPTEIRHDEAFTYAPWLVANVTVDRLPGGPGAALAWENRSWTSNSLGYVVATHQGPAAQPAGSVLTWYLPLSDMKPAQARRLLLDRPAGEWQKLVEEDLLAMNPDLEGAISRIDLWRWAHAMIRPTPGFIWQAARGEDVRPPLFLAHSDQSGLSLFEEAHYRGTAAAEAAMRHLRHDHRSLL